MFFNTIEEFERTFTWLDRVNDVLFTFWKDASAEKYKNGELAYLESFYRSYISDMREACHEMQSLKQQIDESRDSFTDSSNQLFDICQNPDIQGCKCYDVYGYTDEDKINSEIQQVAVDEYGDETDAIDAADELLFVEKAVLHHSL